MSATTVSPSARRPNTSAVQTVSVRPERTTRPVAMNSVPDAGAREREPEDDAPRRDLDDPGAEQRHEPLSREARAHA